jgi:hypothetical protein
MIRQDDVILNSKSNIPFREYGCAVFCIQYLAVMYDNKTFTREQFLIDSERWIREGIMRNDTFVLDWNRLAKGSGLNKKLVFEKGTHILPANRKLKTGEVQLLYLYNPETGYHHFVVGDENDNMMYDSLGLSSTVKAYKKGVAYISSKRVFR